MSKIYDLYPKEQRKIDNQARRIRGYEKMKNDLTNANKRLNRENVKLLKRIDKAIEYLEKNALAPIFLDCKMYETSAYNDLLEILKGSDK